MYIIPNLKASPKLELIDTGRKNIFTYTTPNITFRSKPTKTEVNYFVAEIEEYGDIGELNIKKILKAEIHVFSIEENDTLEPTQEISKSTNGFDNLLLNFGTKRVRDAINKRDIDVSKRKIRVGITGDIKEQILPIINDTENIKEIYLLENLFSDDILKPLKECKKALHSFSLHSELLKYSTKEEFKTQILLLDGLYKTLDRKFVTTQFMESTFFTVCRPMIAMIEVYVENRRLSDLGRDRLIVLSYILLLMVNEFKMELKDFPKFSLKGNKMEEILKLLGCKVKNGKAILQNKPREFIHKRRV
ncbi:hypothetical protein TCON_1461 [Astathelohania contejeani]|uniref:Uncharacterized protein n=1 Tax=Astathelohania contejeani TaxID=164912 RepID=A0ABQ7HYY4_9MICR|nr:hypothetical protein TCON_1461 [Thelohania contejeani]